MQLKQSMRRGRLLAAAVAGLVMAMFAQPALADMGDFIGHWHNVDHDTNNLTRVEISPGFLFHLQVQAFGQCHPTDCDWGTVTGKFEPGMGGTVKAKFNSGFSVTRLELHRAPGGRLSYDMYVQFTDHSGRAPYDVHGLLEHGGMMGGGYGPGGPGPGPGPGGPGPGPGGYGPGGYGPGPGPGPGGMGPIGPSLGAEDCLPEDWASLAVAHVGGDWKIVKGSEWVLDFGANQTAANQALAIIQHYRFDQICYVKRPNPQMTYWKRSGHVPGGSMGGEDCIGLNPNTASVAHLSGDWKVVDGSNWLLDFGSDKSSADQALAVIQTYHLNRQCFVARPNPPMSYWLAQ